MRVIRGYYLFIFNKSTTLTVGGSSPSELASSKPQLHKVESSGANFPMKKSSSASKFSDTPGGLEPSAEPSGRGSSNSSQDSSLRAAEQRSLPNKPSTVITVSSWSPGVPGDANPTVTQPHYDSSGWLGMLSLGFLGSVAAPSDSNGPVENRYTADFCPPVPSVWNTLACAKAVSVAMDEAFSQTIDIAVYLALQQGQISGSGIPQSQQQ